MKPKKIETEARRISIGLVKDVLENIFDTTEMETAHEENDLNPEAEAEEPEDECEGMKILDKRKLDENEEDEVKIYSRPKRSKTKYQVDSASETSKDKNKGVFTTSDTLVPSSEMPRLGTRIKADSVAMMESNKAILDSLPVIEKLRSLSRAGSVKDDASVSEVGDMSDKDSVASGLISRNNKKSKSKKSNSKASGKSKRVNTRSNKGKGRRTIFKKKPIKSLPATATATTSERVYHEGQYWNIGDIVSVVNMEDEDIYYAQLRGFLSDQYSDKYAVITWLLPTRDSPPPNQGFHPATYILGPEEELPRRMEVFTFVMHAPDEYFYNRRAPYRTATLPTDSNFTSTRLGPRLRKNVDGKDIFVGLY